MSEFWAVLEESKGTWAEESGELLADLAELVSRQPEPAQLCVVVLTAPGTALPDTSLLSQFGVRQVYCLEHLALSHYTTEEYVTALAWLLLRHVPQLIVTGATANGRDWAPRLAARLRLPFVPGCLSMELHNDALIALRAAYEGRAYIQTSTPLHGRPALATHTTGGRGAPVTTSPARSATSEPIITHLTPAIPASFTQQRIQSLSIQAPSPEQVELEAAEKIVAGGRGVGREGFDNVAQFARLLGAAVGATRVATDRGWVEHSRQIGATGTSVHPRLYIACGISGAAQHTSGMREAQTVIAINPDRSAPIFALADLGLLGDANQVLPLACELITLHFWAEKHTIQPS